MFDLELFQLINGFAGRSVIADWFAVVIAEFFPYIVGIILGVLWFRISSWREKVRVFLILSFSLILARGFFFEIIRFFYERPRPFVALGFSPLFIEQSYAFPSSHAIVLTVIAGVVFLFSRRWGYFFFGFAIINALSRIYSGVHWPTDSIGGIVVALISVFIASRLFPKEKSERGSQSLE